jgi:hypothetical protein
MHVHLPKPLHGWRAFAGEVGIIVVGVLIALGAEQVVEHFRQRAELREAENGMVVELRDDDLPQAYTRAAVYNCYADQLESIEAAVAAGDRPKFLQLAKAYRPIFRTWDDQAWQAAVASQVLVNSGTKRMQGWATAYVVIPVLTRAADAEQEELPQLWTNLSGSGRLSADQQDRLFQVISILRRYDRHMSASSLVFMKFTRDIGLVLTPAKQREILTEARKNYGACVHEPSPDQMNLHSQMPINTEAQLGRR